MVHGIGWGKRALLYLVKSTGLQNWLPSSGGCMREVPQELTAEQQQQRTAKVEYVANNKRFFTGFTNERDLLTRCVADCFTLFQPSAVVVLSRKSDDYQVAVTTGVNLVEDQRKLNLGQTGGIVRAACEAEGDRQGLLYFPDVNKDQIFLGKEFDRVTQGSFEEKVKVVYVGTAAEYGHLIDLAVLKAHNIRSVACLPLFDLDGRTPLGAMVLLNAELDPLVDFAPLQLLGDAVARQLSDLRES
jgi:hypothetical protein